MTAAKIRPIGRTGLRQYGGVIDEEYLSELRGGRWRRVVRQMQDDLILSASLLAVELLIRQVSWSVMGDDGAAVEFVDAARLGMEKSWDEIVSEILTFLPWGFDVQEIMYKRLPDGRLGWGDWSIRSQETIERWEFDKYGRVTAVIQVAAPDYRSVRIPAEKFILFRTTARKGNPEGRSVLRGAYEPWYFSHNLKRFEAIGIERDAMGVPVARIPAEVIAADGEEYDSYVDLVTNLRADEQAGAVIPSDRDEFNNPLYELSLLTTSTSKQIPIDPVIDRYERQKAMALLTDIIMLGHGGAGSFALAQQKQEMLTAALNAHLEGIAETVNKYAIPRLLELNGMEGDLPRLAFSRIENVDLEALGLFILRVSKAGFDWSDDEAVGERLRQQAELPLV